jgi:hypothetical protein
VDLAAKVAVVGASVAAFNQASTAEVPYFRTKTEKSLAAWPELLASLTTYERFEQQLTDAIDVLARFYDDYKDVFYITSNKRTF